MNNLFNNLKRGFTLAEVLATLTILGVVASITIPSTIHRVEKNHFITKYRKAYAALNTAFDEYEIETNYAHPHLGGNDPVCPGGYVWSGSVPCKKIGIATVLAERLNIKGNRPANHTYNQLKDIGKYIYSDNNPYTGSKRIKNLDGSSNGIVYGQTALILKDGTQINISSGHPHLVCENANCPNWTGDYSAAFFIDVNGDQKGPNTIGKDIFIAIGLRDGLYPWPLPEKFNKTNPFYTPIPRNDYYSKCTKNSSGFACSSWFLNHSDYDK